MNAFAMETNVEPRGEPRTTVRVTGVLDVAAARRLAEVLRRSARHEELHVDLRSARGAHDAAVVALARALRGKNAVMLGLSRHQERLLGRGGVRRGAVGPTTERRNTCSAPTHR